MTFDERIIFVTILLILKNQSGSLIKIIPFYVGKQKIPSKFIFFFKVINRLSEDVLAYKRMLKDLIRREKCEVKNF